MKKIFAQTTLAVVLVACAGGDDSASDGAGSEAAAEPVIYDVATEYDLDFDVQPSTMQIVGRGVRYLDIEEGTGPVTVAGHRATIDYRGWLPDGTLIDSSEDKPPYRFVLGARDAIAGWDEAIPGMRVGGRRILVVPPELAYPEGRGPVPPGATLVFDIRLLDTGP